MRIWISAALVLVGSALVLAATTMPDHSATAPTTRPMQRQGFGSPQQQQRFEQRTGTPRRDVSPTRGLPITFEEVAVRNIFIKGEQRPLPPPPPSGNSGGYQVVTPPSDLVLTGVALTDTGSIALLEDKDLGQVTVVRMGDVISSGKIVNIALDSLEYQMTDGHVIRVKVGYNLAGGEVWGVNGPSTQASTQPSRAGPRQPGESMEDYLKRRRAAELPH